MIGLPRSLLDIARGQHGLVTRVEALRFMSSKQIESRLAAGVLEQLRRGVYRVGGLPATWAQELLGACLAVPGALASYSAAAHLHGLDPAPERSLEITVPRRRPVRLGGVVVHDSRFTSARYQAHVSAIPCTSVARTLYDLSGVLDSWKLERAVDDALRRKLLRLGELRAVAAALDGRGRRRCTVTRGILEARAPGFHPGDSHPEVRISRLLVAAGLPAPVQQHWLQLGSRRVRIDLCYPEERIAIEYDGWDFHSSRSAFDDDRARANELVLLGFSVLRFTSKTVDATIVDTVRAALRRARTRRSP